MIDLSKIRLEAKNFGVRAEEVLQLCDELEELREEIRADIPDPTEKSGQDIGHEEKPYWQNKGTEPIYRVLRVLEYTGTMRFIEMSVHKRQIKGSYHAGGGVIREAILGDPEEILDSSPKGEFDAKR